MQNQPTAPAPGCGNLPAYGQLVAGLLDEQSPEAWQKDLWAIFSGYMVNESGNGYNPRLGDLFSTFRDLHQLFEQLKAVQAGKESRKL